MNDIVYIKYFYKRGKSDNMLLPNVIREMMLERRELFFADFYRVDEDGFIAAHPSEDTRGGILCISKYDAPPEPEAAMTFFREAVRECDARELHGVFFDCALDDDNVELLTMGLVARGLSVFLRGDRRDIPASAYAVVRGSVSGGSFREFIAEQARRFGPEKLCVELCTETLELSPGDIEKPRRIEFSGEDDRAFYSHALCMAYIYKCENDAGNGNFTLFDTEFGIKEKLRIISEAGIKRVSCTSVH